jgi:hypothetical protein
MWSSRRWSGGPAAIPVGDRRIPSGGGWGSVLWATRGRFGAWLVEKGRPAGVLRGSRRRPPLERLLRRDGRLGGGGLVNGRRAMVGAGEQVLGRWDHGERPGTRCSCAGCRRRRRAREKRPWPLYIANEQARGVKSTGRRHWAG